MSQRELTRYEISDSFAVNVRPITQNYTDSCIYRDEVGAEWRSHAFIYIIAILKCMSRPSSRQTSQTKPSWPLYRLPSPWTCPPIYTTFTLSHTQPSKECALPIWTSQSTQSHSSRPYKILASFCYFGCYDQFYYCGNCKPANVKLLI